MTVKQNIVFWTMLSHLKFIIWSTFCIYFIIYHYCCCYYSIFNNYATNSLDSMHREILLDILLLLLLILFHLNSYFLYCALFPLCFNVHTRFLQSVLWWLRKMGIIISTIIIISFTFLLQRFNDHIMRYFFRSRVLLPLQFLSFLYHCCWLLIRLLLKNFVNWVTNEKH